MKIEDCFFTAVNINSSTWVDLDRGPTNGIYAPRLSIEIQVGDEFSGNETKQFATSAGLIAEGHLEKPCAGKITSAIIGVMTFLNSGKNSKLCSLIVTIKLLEFLQSHPEELLAPLLIQTYYLDVH